MPLFSPFRYRGYPIETLAEKITFEECAFLLMYGELPTECQLSEYSATLRRLADIPTDLRSKHHSWNSLFSCVILQCYQQLTRRHFLAYYRTDVKNLVQFLLSKVQGALRCLPGGQYSGLIKTFRPEAHPMGMLMACLAAVGTMYPEANPSIAGQTVYKDAEVRNRHLLQVLAMTPTIAANIQRYCRQARVRIRCRCTEQFKCPPALPFQLRLLQAPSRPSTSLS